jgi:GDP-L-fucose synthase
VIDLTDKKVCVTGGNGFFGRHIVDELYRRGCDVFVPRSRDYDLRIQAAVQDMMAEQKPNVIIHAAAHCGGIGLNMEIPGTLFYDNAMMGILMLEESRIAGVEKFVQIGTCCSYPKFTPTPFKESDIWAGYPEETNAAYGIAKRALLAQGQAYNKQYGFNVIHLLIVNLYGPGDHTSLKHSHVIPALIRKFTEAKKSQLVEVPVWGTGKSTREFYYVEDAAKDFVTATEQYDGVEPLNLGTGESVTIGDLALMIADKVGYKGRLVFDPTKPDGQPHRCMDIQNACRQIDLCKKTSLSVGLDKTIQWYYEITKDANDES